MAYGPSRLYGALARTHLPHAIDEPLERDAGERDAVDATRDTKHRTQAYNLVRAGLLEKPLEFGFVMGAPNAQECDLGVLKC